MNEGKCGLVIEFENEEKMAEFVEDLRYHDVLPRTAAVYRRDGLDGDPQWILKAAGSRPDDWRLVVEKVSTERRAV